MSGTGASNLGYGNIFPNSNINSQYVNVTNSHDPASFSSKQIPGLPGLSGAKWNVDAAKGYTPGICVWKGGLRKKIKNITKMYKMKGRKKRINTLKRKLFQTKSKKRNVASRRRKNTSSRRKHYGGYGGYAQYQNNLPFTNTYSTGGILSANQSALANPVPFQRLSNCVNCQDNYNHYTSKGSPSAGH
jgi:hypothetical protein